MAAEKISILFVCMGNICRSPTAEGVFRSMVEEAGLSDRVIIESAGTTGYHAGGPPDRRALEAAQRRGYDLSKQRAREVTREDCARFDYVLAMDSDNMARLSPLCGDGKTRRLLEFADGVDVQDVPDPYCGDGDGFERVLDLIESAAEGLLDEVRARLQVS